MINKEFIHQDFVTFNFVLCCLLKRLFSSDLYKTRSLNIITLQTFINSKVESGIAITLKLPQINEYNLGLGLINRKAGLKRC